MYVAYVIYNLRDDADLTMLGYSKTMSGAIRIIEKEVNMEQDYYEGSFRGVSPIESVITVDDDREYGYQWVNGGLDD